MVIGAMPLVADGVNAAVGNIGEVRIAGAIVTKNCTVSVVVLPAMSWTDAVMVTSVSSGSSLGGSKKPM